MTHQKRLLLCVFFAAVVAAIGAVVWWHVAFPRFGSEEIAKIEPGMSEREVITILGEPHRKRDDSRGVTSIGPVGV
ncbi:MAG: hypothetical protein JSU70_16160 [Phycisphaerales bacterium]|nr:MAG: hypothetical protein JSU70_16160 [Phycisphaerales bacterium]